MDPLGKFLVRIPKKISRKKLLIDKNEKIVSKVEVIKELELITEYGSSDKQT